MLNNRVVATLSESEWVNLWRSAGHRQDSPQVQSLPGSPRNREQVTSGKEAWQRAWGGPNHYHHPQEVYDANSAPWKGAWDREVLGTPLWVTILLRTFLSRKRCLGKGNINDLPRTVILQVITTEPDPPVPPQFCVTPCCPLCTLASSQVCGTRKVPPTLSYSPASTPASTCCVHLPYLFLSMPPSASHNQHHHAPGDTMHLI